MKWIIILLNVAALLVAVGLRQYARSSQRIDAEAAYQGLLSRELLDESKVEAYAHRLRAIGSPDSFVQWLFEVIVVVCIMNSIAILLLTRKKGTQAA